MGNPKAELIAIVGEKNVLDDTQTLDGYSTDRSFARTVKPQLVVKPANVDEVQKMFEPGLVFPGHVELFCKPPTLRMVFGMGGNVCGEFVKLGHVVSFRSDVLVLFLFRFLPGGQTPFFVDSFYHGVDGYGNHRGADHGRQRAQPDL